jgi:hypothetical protein
MVQISKPKRRFHILFTVLMHQVFTPESAPSSSAMVDNLPMTRQEVLESAIIIEFFVITSS